MFSLASACVSGQACPSASSSRIPVHSPEAIADAIAYARITPEQVAEYWRQVRRRKPEDSLGHLHRPR